MSKWYDNLVTFRCII